MQRFNVIKILQQELFKLVTHLTIIIFTVRHDSYYSYSALVISNNKKILNSYVRMFVDMAGTDINEKV